MSSFRSGIGLLGFLLALAPAVAAQAGDSGFTGWLPMHRVGEAGDEELRLRQLLGDTTAAGYLLRASTDLVGAVPGEHGSLRVAAVAPQLRTAWNSTIPFTLNDGALWAGRGISWALAGGARLQYGALSVTFVPAVTHARNTDFQTLPSADPERSSFSPPWYVGEISADLPYRPGSLPATMLDLGQSEVSVATGPLAFGASTQNRWWGPGIRNALVLSSNAAGFPHLFFGTREPILTAVGWIDATWLVGGLSESLYFDRDPANDVRSIAAMGITYTPLWEPGLTVGLARSVYGPVESNARVLARFHDPLTRWPGRDGDAEQLLALFGRWLFPEEGFEAYFEWARVELPRSFRDLLTNPHHTQGYTLGLQWARPVAAEAAVRFQTEITYLEQSSTYRQRSTSLFYVSQSVPQGYTHRGKVIGAAIGPGASSQWAAADYVADRWSAGLYGARIRWDNDAYYRQPSGRSEVAHDVSVLAGLRAHVDIGPLRMGAEIGRMLRYNYLYQNPMRGFTGEGATDLTNTNVAIHLTPLLRPTGERRRRNR